MSLLLTTGLTGHVAGVDPQGSARHFPVSNLGGPALGRRRARRLGRVLEINRHGTTGGGSDITPTPPPTSGCGVGTNTAAHNKSFTDYSNLQMTVDATPSVTNADTGVGLNTNPSVGENGNAFATAATMFGQEQQELVT